MEDATLSIGQVAKQVGLKTSAIRYYERVGVLPEPERTGGQRRYTQTTVRRLQVLDVAKRAGFTLDEAKMLLADSGELPHGQLQELAVRKLSEVDALIERATAMRGWLSTAAGCGCRNVDDCGLFELDALAPPPPQLAVVHVQRAREDSNL